MEELVQIIKQLEKRIEILERQTYLMKNVVIPIDGKLVVDKQSSGVTAEAGRIYYDTGSHKFKVYENTTLKTITTS